MVKKDTGLNKMIENIENSPEIMKLPPEMRKFIKQSLENAMKIHIPIVTFTENDWVIATSPVIDVSAQGRTEQDAIDNLKAMIDDYMTDPDTEKPKINSIITSKLTRSARQLIF